MNEICLVSLFEEHFQKVLTDRASVASSVDGLIMFVIVGEQEGIWTFDLRKDQTPKVYPGKVPEPDVSIIIRFEYLDQILSGEGDPKEAREKGLFEVAGDEKKFHKFNSLLSMGGQLDVMLLRGK